MLFTFELLNETHTLGNLIVTRILKQKEDVFVSYRVPHPLCKDVHITVDCEEEAEAWSLVQSACESLAADIQFVIQEEVDADVPKSEVRVRQGKVILDKDVR